MTDLRARLTDALLKHTPSGAEGCVNCWCNTDQFQSFNQQANHVADVLLSLPGITITELPPVTIQRDTYCSWLFCDAGEIESVTWPAADDDIAVSGIGSYTVSEARVFAAALLAAIHAAEARQ